MFCASACLLACAALAQGIPEPPPVERDVAPGNPGTFIFAQLSKTTNINSLPPTNSNVIVIGSGNYVVLKPTTNDVMSISTEPSLSPVTLAVYSRQFLYDLVASDSAGTFTNPRARVTFDAVGGVEYDVQLTGTGTIQVNYELGSPAKLTKLPQGTSVPVGCSISLSAFAIGVPAPVYQWQFNDQDLPGQTNSTLLINNVNTNQTGNYRIKATNFLTMATSPEALVTVVPLHVSLPLVATNGSVQFTISGVASHDYSVESTTNLVGWQPAATVTTDASGSVLFTDSQASTTPARFFRVMAICN